MQLIIIWLKIFCTSVKYVNDRQVDCCVMWIWGMIEQNYFTLFYIFFILLICGLRGGKVDWLSVSAGLLVMIFFCMEDMVGFIDILTNYIIGSLVILRVHIFASSSPGIIVLKLKKQGVKLRKTGWKWHETNYIVIKGV